MKIEYTKILKFLYDEFGDVLIEVGKNAINNKLYYNGSQNEKTGNIGDEEKLKSNEEFFNEEDDFVAEENFSDEVEGDEKESLIEINATDYSNAKAFERETLIKMKKGGLELMYAGDVSGAIKDL
ncbi:MAG: hypothetical protein ACRCUS_05580, partial [Anaerovoracaceae bacterium]